MEENFGELSVIDKEFHEEKNRLHPTSTSRSTVAVPDKGPTPEAIVSLLEEESKQKGPIKACRDSTGKVMRLEPVSGDMGEAHGFLGRPTWNAPVMTKFCNAEARPGYSATLAHEYEDETEVLYEKVDLLAQLILNSRRCLLYTGAGLSTSAGIGDYATRDSSGERAKESLIKSPIVAKPTFAHYVLAELCHR